LSGIESNSGEKENENNRSIRPTVRSQPKSGGNEQAAAVGDNEHGEPDKAQHKPVFIYKIDHLNKRCWLRENGRGNICSLGLLASILSPTEGLY
jgi:hypothetical protein